MSVTRAERRLRNLLFLWLFLFGIGALALTALPWLHLADDLAAMPTTFAIWVGQFLLLACTWYLLGGIRDNEHCALVISWYRLIAGVAMIVLAFGLSAGSPWALAGGGVLDLVQGFLTFTFFLQARRSRALRMPLSLEAHPIVDEEPGGTESRTLRIFLAVATVCCGIFGLFLLARTFWTTAHSVEEGIGLGNAAGAYCALAFVTMMSAEAPRRRIALLDIVIAVNALGALGCFFWRFFYEAPPPYRTVLLVAGIVHLVFAVGLAVTSRWAARAERPDEYLGAWLHQTFEKFAGVVLRGNVEVVTAREIADAADARLSDLPSRSSSGIRLALMWVEVGPLFRAKPPLSRLGRLEREAYLADTHRRGYGIARDLIKVKNLVFLLYYSDARAQQEIGFTPWPERVRYQAAKQAGKLPIGPIEYPQPPVSTDISVEVCVIGSGAGGGVAAARLAEGGAEVLIIEEGPWLKRDRIVKDELTMQVRAYRDAGLQSTADMDMSILQGRCVGGGTFLNNGILFEPRPHVLENWHELGANVPAEVLAEAFARIRSDLGVLPLRDHPQLCEKGSSHFARGCTRLSLDQDWFEVNLGDCLGCGYCTSGCSLEKKQSMDRSFIPPALAAGAKLIPECRAERIEIENGFAKAVHAVRADGTAVRIRAKKVVVACGAIHSSLLLQRSGLDKNVGTRLSFNVGTWTFAEFKDPVDSFDGVQMCAYHERKRFFLETIALPPATFAAAMPGWFLDHFEKMRRYRHYAVAGVLIGSQAVGQVKMSRIPILKNFTSPARFALPPRDLRKLVDGIGVLTRVWLAAGASRVIPATYRPIELSGEDQIFAMEDLILEHEDLGTGSAHVHGGNPMSDDREIGVVNSECRLHEVRNVWIADASVFPTSPMVNPQLTIMGMADYAAARVAES